MYNNQFPPPPGQPGHAGQGGANDMHNICWQYLNYYVVGQMADGTQVEGIVEDVNDDGVTMLVPEEVEVDERQFGGYGGYGGVATAEEDSVDSVVEDSLFPYLLSRLFSHFLIITKSTTIDLK